ncbi:hypothetical protein NN561_014936 [Cricetulus griseus]
MGLAAPRNSGNSGRGVGTKTQKADVGPGCWARRARLPCSSPNLPGAAAPKPVGSRLLPANQRAGARPLRPIPKELTLGGKNLGGGRSKPRAKSANRCFLALSQGGNRARGGRPLAGRRANEGCEMKGDGPSRRGLGGALAAGA